MNGFAGSSRPRRQKQELAGSNGAVRASKRENGDPVVGLAVRIVEIIAIDIHCTPFPLIRNTLPEVLRLVVVFSPVLHPLSPSRTLAQLVFGLHPASCAGRTKM